MEGSEKFCKICRRNTSLHIDIKSKVYKVAYLTPMKVQLPKEKQKLQPRIISMLLYDLKMAKMQHRYVEVAASYHWPVAL